VVDCRIFYRKGVNAKTVIRLAGFVAGNSPLMAPVRARKPRFHLDWQFSLSNFNPPCDTAL
jgi:hypothetical protein